MGQTAAILSRFLARQTISVNATPLDHFCETSTRRSLYMAFLARQLCGVDAKVAQTRGLLPYVRPPNFLQGLRGYSGTLSQAMARVDRRASRKP
jgi:hypothetical protein